MIHRAIRRTIQAGIRPTPTSVIAAESLPRPSPAAVLAIGSSATAAVDGLDIRLGPRTLLIPDRRKLGAPGPRLTHTVAASLARSGAVAIGLPATLGTAELRRWNALATTVGATVTLLDDTGWNRVEFGDRSSILESSDLPAALYADATIVALSRPAGAGSIGLWTDIVHPNTSLRARVAGNAVAELAMAVDAHYLVAGQIGSAWMVALATPAIVAELIARAYERLRDRLEGIESTGPWEDNGVQHLFTLGDASTETTDLVLDTWLEDNAGEGIARQLAEMLGWRLRRQQG
jgi:hypothetical protein